VSVVGDVLPEGARRTSYDIPGGPLAAVELAPAGARGTVLLVPGFTGSKEDFGPLLPALAAGGWRAVALDQRGQYASAGPADPGAYAVAALAEDLLAVRARLGDGPVHLLGHSFGGLVARAAVVARPSDWRSLVLLGSGPGALPGVRAEQMAFLQPLLEAGGLAAVLEAMEATQVPDPLRAPTAEVRAFLRRRFLASSADGLLAMGEALLAEPDRVTELAATGVPVLVAHGAADDAWPPATQHEMAGRLGASYAVVPASWHSPAAENPAGTAEVLLPFWADR
jgi:pimeloyl-ACP methyl ester carboxylesterase